MDGINALFFFFCIGVGLVIVVFWIWALIDCLNNESSEGNEKIVWILVIILLGAVGALLYYTVRRPTRIKEVGK